MSGDLEDDSGNEGQSEICQLFVNVSRLILSQNSNRLTKFDSELARYHGILEKKYSNDHDAGYTYIDPVTSDSILLTPFMIKEWAHAMVIYYILY